MSSRKKSGVTPIPNPVPGFDPELGTRLTKTINLIGHLGEAARLVGVTDETVAAWRDGQSKMPLGAARILANAAGVRGGWLMDGEEPMEREARGSLAEAPVRYVTAGELAPEGYALLPRYDIDAAAGAGAAVLSERIVDYLAFKKNWLTVRMGLEPAMLCLVRIDGDSMTPTLHHDDVVLVNRGDRALRHGGIYMIGVDDDAIVKRVAWEADRSAFTLVSDHKDEKAYPPRTYTPAKAAELRVIGRIVWVSHPIR